MPRPYPIPPASELARVDLTACLDGYRVWVGGRPYQDFASLSNAARVASALMTLDALDAWPVGMTGAGAEVRARRVAS